jgi:transposase
MAYCGRDFPSLAEPRCTRCRSVEALVLAQHTELLEQHQSNTQQIEHLKLVIEKYRRMIFGSKSEKLTGQLEQLQFRLEELETAQAATEAAQQRSAPTTTRSVLVPHASLCPKTSRVRLSLIGLYTCCPDCGGALRQFGEDVSEQLERIRPPTR